MITIINNYGVLIITLETKIENTKALKWIKDNPNGENIYFRYEKH